MTVYGITTDYEYTSTHQRERLLVWSPPFFSVFEGEALSLPNGAGYMVTTYNGDKVRVACPSPRTDANYQEVDDAIGAALNAHHTAKEAAYVAEKTARLEYLRGEIEAERISYGELAELESLARFIDPADTLLLQWANVPEFEDEA